MYYSTNIKTLPGTVQYIQYTFNSKYFNYTRNMKHKLLPAKQAKFTHTYKKRKGNLSMKCPLSDTVYYVG